MKWHESTGPEPQSTGQECGLYQMSPGRARGDAWLLPDDRIIDQVAVEIAAKGWLELLHGLIDRFFHNCASISYVRNFDLN